MLSVKKFSMYNIFYFYVSNLSITEVLFHMSFFFFFPPPYAARNNYHTRHLAKILIHLTWCLQESISASGASSIAYGKAVNAVYISSLFLKYLIENAKTVKIEELYLSLDESEPIPTDVPRGNSFLILQLNGYICLGWVGMAYLGPNKTITNI